MNNELGVDYAQAVLNFLPKAIKIGKSIWKKFDDSIEHTFRSVHYDYATSIINKYSKAKTFLIRSEPVDLYDFYIPASVNKPNDVRVEQVNLSKLKDISKRLIITGSGGSGKTILLRHLLLDALLNGHAFPIYIQLRNLNDDRDRNLMIEIKEVLNSNGFTLDDRYIEKSLEAGLFVLLLDGFDEVIFAKRSVLEREIKSFSSKYDCQVIVTSRADTSLQSWDDYSNVTISTLTLDEACALVEKIKFDEDIKTRFLSSLRDGLFVTHSFFLSNPLLLSIMLLTYGDSADIPKKLSSFYLQAFEALFHQHDALKSSFSRDRKTDLDLYEFSRLFAAFCIISYQQRAFTFVLSDALKFVKKAIDITALTRVSANGFLDDAKQAVCLIMEDGLGLSFVHRSFQEFFAAKFICDADERTQKLLIANLTSSGKSDVFRDSVIGLLHEMNPLLVEELFLIPRLAEFFGFAAGKKVTQSFWLSKMKSMFDGLIFIEEDRRLWFRSKAQGDNLQSNLLSFVLYRYLDQSIWALEHKRWIEQSEKFEKNHLLGNESKSLDITDLKVGSPVTKDISNIHIFWSPAGFEEVRKCLKEMQSRVERRASTIEDIFDVA
jgi:hypothetical protein